MTSPKAGVPTSCVRATFIPADRVDALHGGGFYWNNWSLGTSYRPSLTILKMG